jgi:hypothetical protein
VHGRRALVCSHSQVTTPSAPDDAFFNFGIRDKAIAPKYSLSMIMMVMVKELADILPFKKSAYRT